MWPFSTFNPAPVAAFHSRAVVSYDAVTICRASGLKAAELTMERWPISTERKRSQSPVCFANALPPAAMTAPAAAPVSSVRRVTASPRSRALRRINSHPIHHRSRTPCVRPFYGA